MLKYNDKRDRNDVADVLFNFIQPELHKRGYLLRWLGEDRNYFFVHLGKPALYPTYFNVPDYVSYVEVYKAFLWSISPKYDSADYAQMLITEADNYGWKRFRPTD